MAMPQPPPDPTQPAQKPHKAALGYFQIVSESQFLQVFSRVFRGDWSVFSPMGRPGSRDPGPRAGRKRFLGSSGFRFPIIVPFSHPSLAFVIRIIF